MKKESIEDIKDENVDELKVKLDELKSKIDKFQKKLLEKFDNYVLGISLLPPKNIEKEKQLIKEQGKELSKEELEKLKKQINVLVVVDDSDSKKMSKLELRERLYGVIKKMGEEIDKNLNAEVLILSEIKQDCFDGKYELLQDLAISAIIYDPKDLLAAFKVSEVHKQMVLKKFEKYIVSYVAAGSLFRGEKSNDIDVYIIVDDTDVKRMPRFELRDKLRHIIITQAFEANSITNVKKKFHVQVYILTDFWDGIKDANPVFFTLLRDGVPLYDRGVFMPWKLLLEMGRIKPSREAIDMFMDSGEKLLKDVNFRLRDILELNIYWAVLNPSQAALMMYGIAPPTPKETANLLDEIFVKREKLLEKKYVNIFDRIRQTYKDLEHEKIKDFKGQDVDNLLKDANEYLKRIRRLFEQIEKKKEKESVNELYKTINNIITDVLKTADIKSKSLEAGLKKLIDLNEIPGPYLKVYKDILKAKQDYNQNKLSKQEIDKVRRESSIFIRNLVDYIQRKKGLELSKRSIKVKYEDKFGEVLLLDKFVFIIRDISKREEIEKAELRKDNSFLELQKSDLKELNDALNEFKFGKAIMLNSSIFNSLRKIFGDKVEILY